MIFIFYFVMSGLCIWNSHSYNLGPSLEDLENKKCPIHKPIICIPYGACCSYSEFCHAGLCESCFYDRFLTNLQEWCRELGQYNVSLMRSDSCKFACQDRFTLQELMPKNLPYEGQSLRDERVRTSQEQSKESDGTFHVPTFVLIIIILILVLVIITSIFWQRFPYKFKCLKLHKNRATGSVATPAVHVCTAQKLLFDKLQGIEEFMHEKAVSVVANNSPDMKQVETKTNDVKSCSTSLNDDAIEKSSIPPKNILTKADIENQFIDLKTKDSALDTKNVDSAVDELQVEGCEAKEVDPLMQKNPEGGAIKKRPKSKNERREDSQLFSLRPVVGSTATMTSVVHDAVEEKSSVSPMVTKMLMAMSEAPPPSVKSNKAGNRKPALGSPLCDVNWSVEDFVHIHNEETGGTDDLESKSFLNRRSLASDDEDDLSSLDSSSKGAYANSPTIKLSEKNQLRQQTGNFPPV